MSEQRESFAAREVDTAHLGFPKRAMYRLLHAGAISPNPSGSASAPSAGKQTKSTRWLARHASGPASAATHEGGWRCRATTPRPLGPRLLAMPGHGLADWVSALEPGGMPPPEVRGRVERAVPVTRRQATRA